MAGFSTNKVFGIYLRESADDGSDFSTPDADYRLVYLGEDGALHAKDSAGAVTSIGGGAGSLDLSALTAESRIQGITDYVAGYDGSAADERGFPVGQLMISRQHTVIRSECFPGMGTAGGGAIASGSPVEVNGGIFINLSSGAVAQVASEANHPGIIQLSTSTSTTGRCAMANVQYTDIVVLGGGKARYGGVFKIPTLSDVTNTFTVWAGFSDLQTGNPTDGVFFRYTHGTNSGKWEGVCRSNGSETARDTAVTADTSWHTYEVEINAAGTSVQFYIDGVATGAAVTTNIPTGTGRETGLMPCYIVKSAGGTARTVNVDAFWYILEFTTAR